MSQERDERIMSRAREYARSGDHTGWLSVEGALSMEFGSRRPNYLLDNYRTREELDRMCKEARKDKTGA